MGHPWGLCHAACPHGSPHCAQENLLLSVLPAHISMGMKLAIIERLKEHGDRRYMPDNNFHSLYVKRHQNVRWAAGRGGAFWAPQGQEQSRFLNRRLGWCWGRARVFLKSQSP